MSPSSKNSLGSRDTLTVGKHSYEIYRLDALEKRGIGRPSTYASIIPASGANAGRVAANGALKSGTPTRAASSQWGLL